MKTDWPKAHKHYYGAKIATYDGQAYVEYITTPVLPKEGVTDVYEFCPKCGKQLRKRKLHEDSCGISTRTQKRS